MTAKTDQDPVGVRVQKQGPFTLIYTTLSTRRVEPVKMKQKSSIKH